MKKKKPASDRVIVVRFFATPEYREWINGLNRHARLDTMSSTISRALEDYAKAVGFRAPPRRLAGREADG
ncbi:MAG: hypothetical protein KGM43_13065 [Planctomycetota bacterium]|nr:hypothetical protein [Planctomycetota bacterium]